MDVGEEGREKMAAGGALVAELLRLGAPALRAASELLEAAAESPGEESGPALQAVGERLGALAGFLETAG